MGGRTLNQDTAAAISRNLKIISIFVINPFPIVDSFWKLPLNNAGAILLLPVLGILSIFVGGGSAVIVSSLFRIPPLRAASVFTCGMFTNILSFGGLTAFVFYGARGYALVQLYNMLISPAYFLVGFPLSRRIAHGTGNGEGEARKALLREQPYLIVPILAMATGIVLNELGLPRPHILDSATDILVPTLAGTLGFSIGLTLFVSKVSTYKKEIPLIMLIKFLVVPAIMIPLGALVGLPTAADGLAFRVLVILSVMPVAFNSLVPPALYGFDLDLANSAWIVTTVSLVVILPVLYLALRP